MYCGTWQKQIKMGKNETGSYQNEKIAQGLLNTTQQKKMRKRKKEEQIEKTSVDGGKRKKRENAT